MLRGAALPTLVNGDGASKAERALWDQALFEEDSSQIYLSRGLGFS